MMSPTGSRGHPRPKPRIMHYNRLKPYLDDVDLGWWRSASTGHPVSEENGEPWPTGPAPHSASQSMETTPEASLGLGEPQPYAPASRSPSQAEERTQDPSGGATDSSESDGEGDGTPLERGEVDSTDAAATWDQFTMPDPTPLTRRGRRVV